MGSLKLDQHAWHHTAVCQHTNTASEEMNEVVSSSLLVGRAKTRQIVPNKSSVSSSNARPTNVDSTPALMQPITLLCDAASLSLLSNAAAR